MNFKTTGILILLLAGLTGYYFWAQSGPKPTTPQDTALSLAGEGALFFPYQLIDVDRLTLITPDGKRTTIERGNDGWSMTEPIQAPAATQSVLATIDAILKLRSHGQPDSDPGAASGLDKPRYTVQLHLASGKTSTLTIGESAGVGDVLYAQLDGGPINLLDGDTTAALDLAENDLRDKRLFQFDPASIKLIDLATGSSHLAVANQGGNWKIIAPQQLAADNDEVDQFLSSIGSLQATDFLRSDADELTFARFDQPTTVLRLGKEWSSTRPTTSESDLVLTIGAPVSLVKDKYYARTSDGLYCKIDARAVDGLDGMDVNALRDRVLANIDPDQVTGIRIIIDTYAQPPPGPIESAPATPISETTTDLRRAPPPVQGPAESRPSGLSVGWQFADDPKSQVELNRVARLLKQFNPLKAQAFADALPATPIGKKYTVILTTASGQYQIEISVPYGGEDGTATYNHLVFSIARQLSYLVSVDFHQSASDQP
jgi:hypothetical protein